MVRVSEVLEPLKLKGGPLVRVGGGGPCLCGEGKTRSNDGDTSSAPGSPAAMRTVTAPAGSWVLRSVGTANLVKLSAHRKEEAAAMVLQQSPYKFWLVQGTVAHDDMLMAR
jgi:hypothetical protein